MKGAIMNKTVNNLPFVYASQTYKKIGEGMGLDYNLVP